MLLLCETEDSIFKYEQFNGHTHENNSTFGLAPLGFFKDAKKPSIKPNEINLLKSETTSVIGFK